MKFSLLILVCLIILSAGLKAQNHSLQKLWETDSVFKVPESVLFDAENNVLYVSNIDGKDPWAADGAGSIGKMDANGKSIVVDWVKGLQAPKGMGLYKGMLYVADLTDVVVINTNSGVIEKRIAVPGAMGLNDISVDQYGILYVSDSKGKKVYRVENGQATLFLENLKGPNGVLAHLDDFYVLDAGGMYRMNKDKTLSLITEGMEGGTDGIENINGKEFIISCWQGVLWHISSDGSKQQLLDTRAEKKNTADIGMDAKNKIIYVPTFWSNTVVAYQVK
jgi:hypothetical protein